MAHHALSCDHITILRVIECHYHERVYDNMIVGKNLTRSWTMRVTTEGIEEPDCECVIVHQVQAQTATFRDIDYWIGECSLLNGHLVIYREDAEGVDLERVGVNTKLNGVPRPAGKLRIQDFMK